MITGCAGDHGAALDGVSAPHARGLRLVGWIRRVGWSVGHGGPSSASSEAARRYRARPPTHVTSATSFHDRNVHGPRHWRRPLAQHQRHRPVDSRSAVSSCSSAHTSGRTGADAGGPGVGGHCGSASTAAAHAGIAAVGNSGAAALAATTANLSAPPPARVLLGGTGGMSPLLPMSPEDVSPAAPSSPLVPDPPAGRTARGAPKPVPPESPLPLTGC